MDELSLVLANMDLLLDCSMVASSAVPSIEYVRTKTVELRDNSSF